jgi:hypothetical protein
LSILKRAAANKKTPKSFAGLGAYINLECTGINTAKLSWLPAENYYITWATSCLWNSLDKEEIS